MRRPHLALAFALYAVAFTVVSALCYYDGFFRYASHGVEVWTTDLAVETTPGRWSVVPFGRAALSFGILGGLAWCARAFYRGDPRARLVGFWLCLGWMSPQARFLALYFAYRHFAPWQAWGLSAALVVAPAALLSTPGVIRAFDRYEHTLPWADLAWGRRRLVAVGVLLAWTFYLAEIFLAAWPWFGPWLRDASGVALAFGLATATLAVVTSFGLLKLRTWSVLAALACGACTAAAALFARAGGLEAGYVGGVGRYAWIASPWATALAFAPLALFVALLWPILALLARRALAPSAPRSRIRRRG